MAKPSSKKRHDTRRQRPHTTKTVDATISARALDYPRHSVRKALRVPQAVLEQNAGRPCTDKDSARFLGVGYHGPFRVEVSSAIKYGYLQRPEPGKVEVTALAKQVLRPQHAGADLDGLRQAVLNAPTISDVYKHYRGENLPDEPFFGHTLNDKFGVPPEKQEEFKDTFVQSLRDAELIEERAGKNRLIDVSTGAGVNAASGETLKKISKAVKIEEGDTCFVMMPFAPPIGGYYKTIYDPAIRKAGLRPVRADDDMFATGKIIDQVWHGIHAARILVAELTGRNPNVFYELGLAHALQKPVVLVSSNVSDVPFDVKHIRVIFYDVSDPFWGEKLTAKIAENVLSALQNPDEAVLTERCINN